MTRRWVRSSAASSACAPGPGGRRRPDRGGSGDYMLPPDRDLRRAASRRTSSGSTSRGTRTATPRSPTPPACARSGPTRRTLAPREPRQRADRAARPRHVPQVRLRARLRADLGRRPRREDHARGRARVGGAERRRLPLRLRRRPSRPDARPHRHDAVELFATLDQFTNWDLFDGGTPAAPCAQGSLMGLAHRIIPTILCRGRSS
jgi:hypothetical protein